MDTFEEKIKRARWLRAQAVSLANEADELLDSLGDLAYGTYPAGRYALQVTPTLRFDAATASRNLTKDEFKSILQEKPDATLAKAVLGEERYKATQKTHGVTRKIIVIEEDI
jgi:hypothetical protein